MGKSGVIPFSEIFKMEDLASKLGPEVDPLPTWAFLLALLTMQLGFGIPSRRGLGKDWFLGRDCIFPKGEGSPSSVATSSPTQLTLSLF